MNRIERLEKIIVDKPNDTFALFALAKEYEKINELEKVFANSRIIDESQLDTSKVTVLTNVTIQNVNNGAEVTYKLVAEAEANLKEKKISVNSPIGQGLLGKTVGDLAQIQTPAGPINFKIVNISL